jgi:hypothetical protein
MTKLTDDAVAHLPLHEGRVALLEEILATPAIAGGSERAIDRGRRVPTWLTVGAAAAAVLAAVALPVWLGQDSDGGPDRSGGFATEPEPEPEHGTGPLAVLDAPDWRADHVERAEAYGEVSYVHGDQSLDVTWYPADLRPGYVEDRQRIDHPKVDPGEQVEVLGRGALLWPYSENDHTVIREAQGGFFIEVRGSGMDKDGFLALLALLRAVDAEGLEASLPDEFVTGAERSDAVGAILSEMGTDLPPGYDGPPLSSDEPDRYHLGADIAGGMACAWLDEFAAAKQSGDEARIGAAVDALQQSKDWPILLEMDARGDYPEVVWEYADEVRDGRVPEGYRGGLGCTG